jgi:hypothetical protein
MTSREEELGYDVKIALALLHDRLAAVRSDGGSPIQIAALEHVIANMEARQ